MFSFFKKKKERTWVAGNYGYNHLGRRAAAAATLIEPRSSIMDVGCGPMVLRQHLPEGCTYAGCDFQPMFPEVEFIDLDKRQFPAGKWDYVALLGVLGWITEKDFALEAARKVASKLVVSGGDDELLEQARAAGWNHEKTYTYRQTKKKTYQVSLFG